MSLFGISCTRQMDAKDLINRPAEVTRSTVQKAIVVITDSPHALGPIREKLSVVTAAWFAQRYLRIHTWDVPSSLRARAYTEDTERCCVMLSRDFTDVDIINKFQESLVHMINDGKLDGDPYLGRKLPK